MKMKISKSLKRRDNNENGRDCWRISDGNNFRVRSKRFCYDKSKVDESTDTSTLEFMRGRRIMEVNPDHPIIKDLNAACKNSPESSEAVDLLYETALISSGFTPDNWGARFMR